MGSTSTLVRFTGSTPQPAADDISVSRMRVFDTSVWMTYRRDTSEWQRRRSYGLGAVLAWDLLDTLMDLPAGLPVPASSLSFPDQRCLRRADPGVVQFCDGNITRELVPAVTPLLAVVTSRNWRDGLVAASRFAAYCSRLTVVPEISSDLDEALEVAGRHGIGVAVGRPRPARVLIEPEPLTDWQPTPAWWRFTETIYGQAPRRSQP
jgi:hypothetical protein